MFGPEGIFLSGAEGIFLLGLDGIYLSGPGGSLPSGSIRVTWLFLKGWQSLGQIRRLGLMVYGLNQPNPTRLRLPAWQAVIRPGGNALIRSESDVPYRRRFVF